MFAAPTDMETFMTVVTLLYKYTNPFKHGLLAVMNEARPMLLATLDWKHVLVELNQEATTSLLAAGDVYVYMFTCL